LRARESTEADLKNMGIGLAVVPLVPTNLVECRNIIPPIYHFVMITSISTCSNNRPNTGIIIEFRCGLPSVLMSQNVGRLPMVSSGASGVPTE
jgi:hypothetical protein